MRKKVKETHEGSAADSAAIQPGTKKRRKRMLLILLLAITLLMPVGRYLLSDELEVTFHHLYSPKIRGSENTRLVVLSDLHNHEFGKDNSDLTEQIEALMPDLIIIAGDMVNSDDDNLDILTHLCDELLKIAPVYYDPGNHESHLLYEKGIPLEEMLAEKGVHVLINRTESVTIHKTPFLVGGLTTAPEGYEEYGEEFIKDYEKSDEFKLLISHYPTLYYEYLADTEIDLGVCGHFHGGLVRLPLIGGLFHGDTGLFPKYSGGMYHLTDSTVFVSRGMGGHSGFPRINNRPELAVIDINVRKDPDVPQKK